MYKVTFYSDGRKVDTIERMTVEIALACASAQLFDSRGVVCDEVEITTVIEGRELIVCHIHNDERALEKAKEDDKEGDWGRE